MPATAATSVSGVLLGVLLPVFGCVFAAWLTARLLPLPRWLDTAVQRVTFELLVPVLLFHTMATVPFAEQFDANVLLAYYAPTILLYGLVIAWFRHLGRTLVQANVLALAASYSNAVLLGIPLILRAFGDTAAISLFAIVGMHAALLFFGATFVHELASRSAAHIGGALPRLLRDTLVRLLRNPIVLGLLAGGLVNLSGVELPAPLLATTAWVGRLASWVALIAVGFGLAAYDLRAARVDASFVLIAKLIVHPLLVAAAVLTLGVHGVQAQVLIAVAALPCGINAYLFAVRFGASEAASATAILMSTALALPSIGALLLLLRLV